MSCNKLFPEIDALYAEYVNIWEDVCNIESPTSYKAGVDQCGRYIAEWGEKMGFRVSIFAQPKAGDVVTVTMNPDANAAPITLSGHLDTVHPVGLFGTPPVHRDEEKIYGPGVEDCKGGVIAAMLAMEALKNCGFTARPVRLILQTDEENGSTVSQKATINHICESSKGSAAFLNLEGLKEGKVVLKRKGIISYTLKVTGKEAHASKCATEGANAIREAAYKIVELEKLKDDAGLTCNCGVISGGSVPNTVAGYCEFKINIRFATAEQLEWVKQHVKSIADTVYVPGCTTELEVFSTRLAMEYQERNVQLLARMNEIFERNGLPTLEGGAGNGGSDAAEVTAAGIPCVDSLGVSGGGIHSIHEWCYLRSLADTAKRVAAVVAEY